MTKSAFVFLGGRSQVDLALTATRAPQGQPSTTLRVIRQRLAANRFASALREHARRDNTDDYLNRTGLSSVDWHDGLTRFVQR